MTIERVRKIWPATIRGAVHFAFGSDLEKNVRWDHGLSLPPYDKHG